MRLAFTKWQPLPGDPAGSLAPAIMALPGIETCVSICDEPGAVVLNSPNIAIVEYAGNIAASADYVDICEVGDNGILGEQLAETLGDFLAAQCSTANDAADLRLLTENTSGPALAAAVSDWMLSP